MEARTRHMLKKFKLDEDVNDTETGSVHGVSELPGHGMIYGIQHRSKLYENVVALLSEIYGSGGQRHLCVDIGDFVVVPYDLIFCRAVVTEVYEQNAQIFHVDYGSWDVVSLDHLFIIEEGPLREIPQLAFQCFLEDESCVLVMNEKYTFEIDSVLKTTAYKIFGCSLKSPDTQVVPQLEPNFPLSTKVLRVDAIPKDMKKTEELFVVFKEEPDLIYGTLVRHDFYEEMQGKLNTVMALIPNGVSPFKTGDLVAAQVWSDELSSNIFSRAVFLGLQTGLASVYQIDTGCKIDLDLSKLKPLPEEFAHYPPLVDRFKVTRDVYEQLELESTFNIFNIVKIETLDGLDIHSMTLEPPSAKSEDEKEINTPSQQEKEQKTSEPSLVNPERDNNVADEISTKVVAPEISAHVSAFRKCPMPRFPPLEFIDAKVNDVDDIGENQLQMWFELPDKKNKIEALISEIKDSSSLESLFVSTLNSSEPGLVWSTNYGCWARAEVIGRPKPTTYQVKLVDYGFDEEHPVSGVYRCPASLASIEEAVFAKEFFVSNDVVKTLLLSLKGLVVVLGKDTENGAEIFDRDSGELLFD